MTIRLSAKKERKSASLEREKINRTPVTDKEQVLWRGMEWDRCGLLIPPSSLDTIICRFTQRKIKR